MQMKTADVKKNIGNLVFFNGTEYKFDACTLRKNKDGKLFYQAELLHVPSHSVLVCALENVEIKGESKDG